MDYVSRNTDSTYTSLYKHYLSKSEISLARNESFSDSNLPNLSVNTDQVSPFVGQSTISRESNKRQHQIPSYRYNMGHGSFDQCLLSNQYSSYSAMDSNPSRHTSTRTNTSGQRTSEQVCISPDSSSPDHQKPSTLATPTLATPTSQSSSSMTLQPHSTSHLAISDLHPAYSHFARQLLQMGQLHRNNSRDTMRKSL